MPRKIASPFSALIFLARCILFALNMQSVRVRCRCSSFTLFPTLDRLSFDRSLPPSLSLSLSTTLHRDFSLRDSPFHAFLPVSAAEETLNNGKRPSTNCSLWKLTRSLSFTFCLLSLPSFARLSFDGVSLLGFEGKSFDREGCS